MIIKNTINLFNKFSCFYFHEIFKKRFKAFSYGLQFIRSFTPGWWIIISIMKISFFTNMKDTLNKLGRSNVACQFPCPGWESSYIGKTERTLFERIKEHVTRADSVIKGHLDKLKVKYLFSIHSWVLNDVNTHDFRLNFVYHNTKSIDQLN